MQERIKWLSILRGLNILLVVMFHVQLINLSTGQCFDFCRDICYPFNPVRMPLFIFISGGLLYVSRIRKNIPVSTLYYDKFQRIMIPLFFFTIVYFLIKLLFAQFTKSGITASADFFLESFIYYSDHPSAPLWFLATLMLLMLLYPLFRYLCQHTYLMIVFLIFSAGFFFIEINIDNTWNVFTILTLNKYLIYFFFGIFTFRYQLYNYFDDIKVLIILILLYILSYMSDIPLLCSLTGIWMMCALCMQIVKYLPDLFKSFREYIFQIYLMSLPFQGFVELILWKKMFYHEDLVILFYLLNILAGIYIPVLIAKAIKRCPIRFIRLCFGLS